MAEEESEQFWSLGYGSNMDVDFVQRQKKVQILGST